MSQKRMLTSLSVFRNTCLEATLACVNDIIDPDQFLDGLYDVMGNRIDPFLDELIVGLAMLVGDD